MKGIHPIKAIKSVLPTKLTRQQRFELKLAKTKQKLGQSVVNETGKTIRSLGSQMAVSDTLRRKLDVDSMRQANTQNLNNAVEVYNKLIKGGSDDDSGQINQDKSTTQVGGGSSLNDKR